MRSPPHVGRGHQLHPTDSALNGSHEHGRGAIIACFSATRLGKRRACVALTNSGTRCKTEMTEAMDGGVIMTGQGIDRRRFLRGLGLGAAAIAGGRLLAACGGGSSGLSGDQGGGGASGGASGAKPNLNVWYHQYGEAGTQQAVTRYAKEYPDATVKVQWTPGDYASKLNSRSAVDLGTGRVREQRQHRPGQERPGRRPGRHHRRHQERLSPRRTSRPRPWTARSTRSRWSTTWGCSTTARASWTRPA